MSKLLFVNGNMLESKCDALVCPVNCEGVMGAGVAKLFRENFDNTLYKNACLAGELAPGSVLVRPVHAMAKDTQKTLIYLATKMEWRNDSKMEWVEHGLFNLTRAMYYYGIKSVALPAIGAGKGNLPWPSVELTIKAIFEGDNQTRLIEVYLPHQDL